MFAPGASRQSTGSFVCVGASPMTITDAEERFMALVSVATGTTAAPGLAVPDQLPMMKETYGCSDAARPVAQRTHVLHSLPAWYHVLGTQRGLTNGTTTQPS